MAHYRRREFVAAQNACRDILARDPGHVASLVLLGDLVQQDGRNKQAVKLLSQALARDPRNASAHDTIAIAYHALGRRDDAVAHFTQALMLGLGDAENLVKHSAAIATPLQRLAAAWPRTLPLPDLLGDAAANPLGREPLLLALLGLRPIHDVELERLFTALRRGLPQGAADDDLVLDADGAEFFCALAQQCFINEYVFAQNEDERAQLRKVQDRIAAALEDDFTDRAARSDRGRELPAALHIAQGRGAATAPLPRRADAVARGADQRAARGAGGPCQYPNTDGDR